MPTSITIEADKENQEPTQNAHFAQVSDKLNSQKTKKSGIGKLIFVQEIQVDPCGNGWEKPTLRQTVAHLHFFIFIMVMGYFYSFSDFSDLSKIFLHLPITQEFRL